jgi:hypothetical protein
MDFNEMLNNFSVNSDGRNSNVTVSIPLGTPTKDSTEKAKDTAMRKFMQGFIGENFSRRYVDNEKKIDKTIIINRRQTANIPQSVNTMALEKFIDFSADEVNFMDTKIITPLNSNAISHYKFKLLERKYSDTQYVYVIEVIPNTTVYPTFEGTISILEGTYQLIEANLRPSIDTKIFAIDSLEYYEKFENVGNNIWFPTYLQTHVYVKMKAIPLLPPIEMGITMNAIISDISIDEQLPDSIINDKDLKFSMKTVTTYQDSSQKTTLVMLGADSSKKEYWEDNALLGLTDKDKEMYEQIDTAAKELNIDINSDSVQNAMKLANSKPFFTQNVMIYARYNRVESITAGLNGTFQIPYLKSCGEGLYSYGLHRWLGEAKLEIGNIEYQGLFFGTIPTYYNKPSYSLSGGIFTKINTFGNVFKDVNLFANSLDMKIFAQDYFDYFRSDGWNVMALFGYKRFSISAIYENREDIGLNKFTNSTIFVKKEFRENPQPESGEFNFIRLNATFGNISQTDEHFQYMFSANYQLGMRVIDNNLSNNILKKHTSFSQIRGAVSIQIPIFETGYGNMLLYLSATGGLAERNTPVQYLFGMEHSSVSSNIISPIDNTFITAYQTYFGGTDFFTFHARLNLRDWWWRMLHLPRIKGRGLELTLVAAAGRFFNNSFYQDLSNPQLPVLAEGMLYNSTAHSYYTEAGFRIGRIPIPGTDLITYALEIRFGFGEYARRNLGFLLNFHLPFLM